jgi:RHS repeat-associated protein
VKTVVSGITTYEFRSAQGLLLAEWKKQAGTVDTLKEHIHVAGKEVAEQQTLFSGANIQPVGWMFLQHDASGSVLSATWAGGGLLFKENYQPYGSQINGTAPGYTQRAFAGHKQDAQDLVYMGARYYNPQIGRFLAIDPKEADPSDLHSLNRYAYANNNPYRYVDPDGHSPLDIAFFAVDAVRLGMAIYDGGDVKGAAIDLAMSAVGVVSPAVGTGQVLKGVRAANVAVKEMKGADNALAAGEAAGRTVHHDSMRAARRAAEREAGMGKHGGREQLPDQKPHKHSQSPEGDPGIRTEVRSTDTGRVVHHDPYGHGPAKGNYPPHYGVEGPGISGTTHHTYPSKHDQSTNR